MKTYSYRVSQEADLPQVAEALLQSLGGHRILAFYGQMGAGKTTFIKAICTALEVEDMVNSPTFAIVNQYETLAAEPVFHFDFYRMRSPQEALDIGLDDYLDSGAFCLMEWAEMIGSLLPDEAVKISIDLMPNGDRKISWHL